MYVSGKRTRTSTPPTPKRARTPAPRTPKRTRPNPPPTPGGSGRARQLTLLHPDIRHVLRHCLPEFLGTTGLLSLASVTANQDIVSTARNNLPGDLARKQWGGTHLVWNANAHHPAEEKAPPCRELARIIQSSPPSKVTLLGDLRSVDLRSLQSKNLQTLVMRDVVLDAACLLPLTDGEWTGLTKLVLHNIKWSGFVAALPFQNAPHLTSLTIRANRDNRLVDPARQMQHFTDLRTLKIESYFMFPDAVIAKLCGGGCVERIAIHGLSSGTYRHMLAALAKARSPGTAVARSPGISTTPVIGRGD